MACIRRAIRHPDVTEEYRTANVAYGTFRSLGVLTTPAMSPEPHGHLNFTILLVPLGVGVRVGPITTLAHDLKQCSV